LFEFFVIHRERLCLVWRPHPGLFPALVEQRLLRREQLPELRNELQTIGVVLDEAPSHLQAFVCSDAMLSDAGSFLFDYLAVQRPQLALLNPEGEPLNEEAGALVRASGFATDMAEISRFIDMVVQARVDTRRLAELNETFLPMVDGCSGQRVCEAIISDRPSTRIVVRGAAQSLSGHGNGRDEVGLTARPLGDGKDIAIPPVLSTLMFGLRQVRAEKKAQSRWRKLLRRRLNWMRTWVGETIKQRPALMAAISRLRGI
jgi:CDP-glycerol glycerophosphotransferase (TagB/SpsB family)